MVKWRDTYVGKPDPTIEPDQLDRWLALPTEERTDLALSFVNALFVMVDDMVEKDMFLTIGTTQNKTAFVLVMKSSGQNGKKGYSVYKGDFISILAQIAGDEEYQAAPGEDF